MAGPVTVSVIIPTFNRASFIGNAVRSALDQRGDGLAVEVIVVDDGSTDHTQAALNPYRARITCLSQRNGGPAKARNAGLDASRGRYVVFLDSDDELYPAILGGAVEALERQPRYDAVYGRAFNVDGQGRVLSKWRTAATSGNIFPSVVQGLTLQVGQCVFRGSSLRGCYRFDEAVGFGDEDTKFFMAFSRTRQCLFLDMPFLKRTVHAQMITRTGKPGDLVEKRLKAIEDLFGSEAPAIKRRYLTRPVLADWYRSDGFHRAGLQDLQRARALIVASLRQWPFQWDLYAWLLYQFLPAGAKGLLRAATRRGRTRVGAHP